MGEVTALPHTPLLAREAAPPNQPLPLMALFLDPPLPGGVTLSHPRSLYPGVTLSLYLGGHPIPPPVTLSGGLSHPGHYIRGSPYPTPVTVSGGHPTPPPPPAPGHALHPGVTLSHPRSLYLRGHPILRHRFIKGRHTCLDV